MFKLEAHPKVTTSAPGTIRAIPASLNPILTTTTDQAAAVFLKSLVDCIAESIPLAEGVINGESAYAGSPLLTDDPELKVSNWASGGGLPTAAAGPGLFSLRFYRFRETALTDFFESLFNIVLSMIPGAAYTRNNFFHGHSVLATPGAAGEETDFRIVFHAYEYPSNLESIKSGLAHKLETTIPTFDDSNRNFYKRNAIWSMRSNTIHIPDYYEYLVDREEPAPDDEILPRYLGLLKNGGRGCAVDQALVGREIIGFNFFPSERVRLFLKW